MTGFTFQRVKILFNKKDTALIQMAEAQQASLAINHLDKTKLWGKVIRVMLSKHSNVQVSHLHNLHNLHCLHHLLQQEVTSALFQLPKDGQPDAGLTKDYANSGLHRFKKPGSKNYQNIYPPSATLHLSNIPSSVEEEDLKTAFAAINLTVQVIVIIKAIKCTNVLEIMSIFRQCSYFLLKSLNVILN